MILVLVYLTMNFRFKFYFMFLSVIAVSMVFYSAYMNGYLSWKNDRTFDYFSERSEITNEYRRTDDNIHSKHVEVETPYEGYGNISQCPENVFKPNLTKVFQTWHQIAEQNNVTWILFYGSLLGAIRNEDIIPYDSDIDVLVDATEMTKLRRLEHPRNFTNVDFQTRLVLVPDFNKPVYARRFITCEGKEVTKMVDQCSFRDPIGRLINGEFHIDLYQYYNRGDHIEDPSENKLKRYDVKDFYPFKQCSFLGINCKCPQNPNKLLMQYFETSNLNPSKMCKNGRIWE